MITVKQKGDYSKITKYLERVKRGVRLKSLEKYGRRGVAALASNTPVDTGLTANSWYYKIEEPSPGNMRLSFCNSNIQRGIQIAIILQYGHATGNGGWVEGRDYINPALQPIFDELTKEAWKEVSSI